MSKVSPQREKPGLLLRMIQWLAPRFAPLYLYLRLYRLAGARLVGGGSALLITTVGRRSGRPRTVIVGYRRHGDEVIVVGSNFAKPAAPSWVLNLRAHPDAEVQVGRERYQARAEFLGGENRAGHWDRLVAAEPLYDQIQRVAGREIPVIRLRSIKGSSE